MDKNHIIQAMAECKLGEFQFNNGIVYCFLYNNVWYPLRAVVNRGSFLANENIKYTKDNALVKMHELFDYITVKQVAIEDNKLVHITTEEKLKEIEKLAIKITELTE